jgi:hypothetical protein
MQSFSQFRDTFSRELAGTNFVQATLPQIARDAAAYVREVFKPSPDPLVLEGAEATRYSVEVNYRTDLADAQKAFAKIALGYVSAAMKGYDFHVKLVFDEDPLRILVSSRNWDDGEWVGVISFNPKIHAFVLSRGYYNRDRKTVSVVKSETMNKTSPSEMSSDLRNLMHHLKGVPDRYKDKMKPVSLKRGPK